MNRKQTPTQYEARQETIVRRYGPNREFIVRETYTVQVPVGTPEYKIPARSEAPALDMSKVAEAAAWSAQMFADLSE